MIPPKCRICGTREHGHICRGGTPAQRVEERARVLMAERRQTEEERPHPAAADPVAAVPPPSVGERLVTVKRRSWHDDTDSAGEPTEVRDVVRKPARFYAPPGECLYCDRRREAAKNTMRMVRERGEA